MTSTTSSGVLSKGPCGDLILDAIRVYLHETESISIYHRIIPITELVIRDPTNLVLCIWRENSSICTDCAWCNKVTWWSISDPDLLHKIKESIKFHRSHRLLLGPHVAQ